MVAGQYGRHISFKLENGYWNLVVNEGYEFVAVKLKGGKVFSLEISSMRQAKIKGMH